MLVTKMAKIVNILILSPTHFVSDIRHRHRCARRNIYRGDELDLKCCYSHRDQTFLWFFVITVFGKGSWKNKKLERQKVWNFLLGKSEIRQFPFKLESTDLRWRVFNAVFQLRAELSNFTFPISLFQVHVSRLFWVVKCEKISKLKMFEGNILIHLILFRVNYVLAQIFEPQNHDF